MHGPSRSVLEAHETKLLGSMRRREKPPSVNAEKDEWKAKAERLERKNEELRLRCAGLSRTIRELGEVNSMLRASIAERGRELERAHSRIAALGSAVDRRPVRHMAEPPHRGREERRKAEELSIELIDARRRERRAVELGGVLRRRVADERAAIERCELKCRALEAEVADARAAVDREREATKRERASASHAKKTVERLRATNDDLKAKLSDSATLADEQRLRFADARKRLEAARDAARAQALDRQRDADAAKDECLALKTKLSQTQAQPVRRSLDRFSMDNHTEKFAHTVAKSMKSRDKSRLVKSPPEILTDDDEDNDTPPPRSSTTLPPPPPSHPVSSQLPGESRDKLLPTRTDPTTARFERLQATFNRVVSSQRRR